MTQKARVETRESTEASPATAASLVRSRSLLSVSDLGFEDIAGILALATLLEREDPLVRARRLAKRRVALLFYESSTRTRTSFELAAKSLGADTALISSQSSSIEKGESLKDTGIALRALGAECIILRHLSSGSPYLLARATGLPILNAGDGMHEHPSQALLDLRTILSALGYNQRNIDANTLSDVTVSIAGDIFHSRVARSNALLLTRLGARVILCGPPALLPEAASELSPRIVVERDFDRALEQSRVVMMLRIQKERLAGVQVDIDEYSNRYQLNQERLRQKAPHALVMHPGPMIRGMEITSEVADGPQSLIAEQVRNGVSIRMALVYRALVPQPGVTEAGPSVIRAQALDSPQPASSGVAAKGASNKQASPKNAGPKTTNLERPKPSTAGSSRKSPRKIAKKRGRQ